ncbi:MAG: hypothetical protein WAU65_01310 [Candidatus Nanoarchaeia archaeon]
MVENENIPTIKEKNIFWSNFIATIPTSLITAFFVGAYFNLTKYFDSGPIVDILFFLILGTFLLIIIVWASKKIIPVKIRN